MEIKYSAAIEDTRPTLETPRLFLRPFCLADAKNVQRMAGMIEVTSRTATIPYPYPDGLAESWIQQHPANFSTGASLELAIILNETKELIGCMSLMGLSNKNKKAELGYWVGADFWNQGYCSEAALAAVRFAFEQLQLNKITSRHLAFNLASGKVMQKIGMKYEGTLRQEFFKDGVFHDLVVYGLLISEA
jgi:RimJ/RimL family protein N-acetyltransferase